MRHDFGPAACLVVLQGAAKRSACMELCIEKADAPFDTAAPSIQEFLFFGRIFNMPVAARVCGNGDPFAGELGTFLRLGPIGIVSEKMPLEGGLQKSVEAVDIVAVACDLEHKNNAAFGTENEVLADPVKPAFQRGTVTFSGESAEPFLFACPYGSADIDGMRIDDGKGGFASPSISRKAPERRWIKGVKSARRSAQLGRLRRRGNN